MNVLYIFDSVDVSMAGEGTLAVTVKGQHSQPAVEITPKGHGICQVSFMPQEGTTHSISVMFSGYPLSGLSKRAEV